MSELDTPWSAPETPQATTEWFDESPFATEASAGTLTEGWTTPESAVGSSPEGTPWGAGESAIGLLPEEDAWTQAIPAGGEDLVSGCGSVPPPPRPLLLRGTGTTNSRNPQVGYAQ